MITDAKWKLLTQYIVGTPENIRSDLQTVQKFLHQRKSINTRKNTRTKHHANISKKHCRVRTICDEQNTAKGKYWVRQSSELGAAAPVNVTTHIQKLTEFSSLHGISLKVCRQSFCETVISDKSLSEHRRQAENKYQLSVTNPRNVLHHSKRAANKGGCSVWQTCDWTKMTTLVTVYVFEL